MPEVAISTENVVIPPLGSGIVFDSDSLEYLPEYFFQHLLVGLPLLNQALVTSVPVLDWNR
jgi:hypothetical protein